MKVCRRRVSYEERYFIKVAQWVLVKEEMKMLASVVDVFQVNKS